MTEPDKRYRILVVLTRADRPKYWTFYCPRCQMKVGELANVEVVAMQDVMDMSAYSQGLVGVRCDGRYQGGRCDIWYYYALTDTSVRRPVTRATITISGIAPL